MNRLLLPFCVFSSLLSIGLITMPIITEAHGNMPADSVVVTHQKIYNAAGTIEVGGEGKHFTVQAGGKAIITSGSSVRLLPGTKIQPGGQLTVKVTTKRQACIESKNSHSIAALKQITKSNAAAVEISKACHVYPIPNSETIMLVMNGMICILPIRVQVSNGPEHPLKENKISFPYSLDLSASIIQGSLQTLRLRWGERPENIRILRT